MWLSNPVATPPCHCRNAASRHRSRHPLPLPPKAPGSGCSGCTTGPGFGHPCGSGASVCCAGANLKAFKSGSACAPESLSSAVRSRFAAEASPILQCPETRCSTMQHGPTGCARPVSSPRRRQSANTYSRVGSVHHGGSFPANARTTRFPDRPPRLSLITKCSP